MPKKTEQDLEKKIELEGMELCNAREIVKQLFLESIQDTTGTVKFDPLAYFEKNFEWHKVY